MEWRDQFIHPNNAEVVIAAGYPEPEVHSNFWIFNSTGTPPYNAPANDVERYEKMGSSLNYSDPIWWIFCRTRIPAADLPTSFLQAPWKA